jgi:hypothetical protein
LSGKALCHLSADAVPAPIVPDDLLLLVLRTRRGKLPLADAESVDLAAFSCSALWGQAPSVVLNALHLSRIPILGIDKTDLL